MSSIADRIMEIFVNPEKRLIALTIGTLGLFVYNADTTGDRISGRRDGIDEKLRTEFKNRYKPAEMNNQVIESIRAFIDGHVPDNPAYNDKGSLQRLAEEGKELRKSYNTKVQ